MSPTRSICAAFALSLLSHTAQADCLLPDTFQALSESLSTAEPIEQEGRSPDYAETIRSGDGVSLVQAVRPNRSLSYVVTELGEATLIRGYFETFDVAAKGVTTTGSFEAFAAPDGTLTPLCGADDMGLLVTQPILDLLPQLRAAQDQ